MFKNIFGKKKSNAEIPFQAYTGDQPYSFVSYAHADSEIVFPIIKELHSRGVLMWYDNGIESGHEWSQVLGDRILNCDKLLLFISPDSIQSHHVRQEINFANSKRKQILPVYIKPTKLNAGVEMTISVFQAIFYYAFKNNEEIFYSQTVRALTEGFVDVGAEVTFLAELGESPAMLRLDDYGDKLLPVIIHLPDKGKFLIGRFDVTVGFKQCDFEFNAETKNISRRHSVFERIKKESGENEENVSYTYTVTDLNSKAGTWVNGRKIPPDIPHPIESGNHISFGNAGANYIFEIF